MDSVRDLLSCRRPLFTTWTFGRRRYYSPLVHAVAARMEHAALSGAGADPEAGPQPAPADTAEDPEDHRTTAVQEAVLCS